MKPQPMHEAPRRAERAARPARRGAEPEVPAASRAAVGLVAPKLTKLVHTKIVTPRPPATDEKTLHRERLLSALLAAQGRPAVSAAADALLAAGFSLPETQQEPWLQLLEHADESRIRDAIAALDRIFAGEPIRRRPVLEQRLKRLEELAEDPATRQAATALRRKLPNILEAR